MTQDDRLKKIRAILSDVDGVLTDGRVVIDNQGIESKQFHIRDGMGIRLWQKAGNHFAIVTGRSSHVVQIRATELGIETVRQGVGTKLPVVHEILENLGLEPAEACYIGDDLPDIPAMNLVGLAVAPADACVEAREAAQLVTQTTGGRGAVREAIEQILRAQKRWDELIKKYVAA
ncbi:MAG: HAD hydrolase family protein [Pirellulales bacterium]|nr:HAD hydrolase family protein [Pirellulales bacterium]